MGLARGTGSGTGTFTMGASSFILHPLSFILYDWELYPSRLEGDAVQGVAGGVAPTGLDR
jgi:hypothetical protein